MVSTILSKSETGTTEKFLILLAVAMVAPLILAITRSSERSVCAAGFAAYGASWLFLAQKQPE